MPKQATKKDKQAALRQRHTAPFSSPETPPAENDPPIIVSGGSVTIKSKFPLTASQDGEWYVYQTDRIKVKKIRTRGKRTEEDESNDGQFEIGLFD